MPIGLFGQKRKISQFTTITITPLGQSKAGTETNQEKFKILDALADDIGTSSGTQVIDLARMNNMHVQRCVRLCQEMEGGGWVRQVNSNEG